MSLALVLDLIGTFLWAISGATAGVARRLDLFGILVFPFIAGNLGGITRDAPIRSVPRPAISDWRYLAVSLPADLLIFYAVSGAQKALAFALNPVMAVLLGMLTGVGGMMRDILFADIPTVLRADLYAIGALAGAAVVVIGNLLHVAPAATTIVGALLCFGLLLVAIRHGWWLLTAKSVDQLDTRAEKPGTKNAGRR
jgi:uncharacterized membrane protein YeiH